MEIFSGSCQLPSRLGDGGPVPHHGPAQVVFSFENSNQWSWTCWFLIDSNGNCGTESHIRSCRVMALDSTVNSHPIVQEVVPCAFYIFCLWLELWSYDVPRWHTRTRSPRSSTRSPTQRERVCWECLSSSWARNSSGRESMSSWRGGWRNTHISECMFP